MPDYNAGHASKARYLFLLSEGYAENAIDTWSLGGWVDTGPNSFEYPGEDDEGNETVLCTVEFDDDYNATVTFPDGTTGEVNIDRPDEDDEASRPAGPNDDPSASECGAMD